MSEDHEPAEPERIYTIETYSNRSPGRVTVVDKHGARVDQFWIGSTPKLILLDHLRAARRMQLK